MANLVGRRLVRDLPGEERVVDDYGVAVDRDERAGGIAPLALTRISTKPSIEGLVTALEADAS